MRLLDSCCASTPAQRGGATPTPEKRSYVSQFFSWVLPPRQGKFIPQKQVSPVEVFPLSTKTAVSQPICGPVDVVPLFLSLFLSLFGGLMLVHLQYYINPGPSDEPVVRWFGGSVVSRVHQA